jgi:uncharacterized membrane protein
MPELTLSSFGLFLAAVLSICNMFTDVSRKKVVERHDLVASTFWIRIFAALVLTAALLAHILSGSPPVIHAVAALSPNDLKDTQSLAVKLMRPSDAVSHFLQQQLSPAGRSRLEDLSQAGGSPEGLRAALADSLNTIIKGPLIFESKRFVQVQRSAETERLLAQNAQSETLAYLNRLLIEDAYPQEIARNRNAALFGYSGMMVSAGFAFFVYLLIDVIMITCAQLLLMKALQVSPMSVCIPFMAFTPVFLIVTGYIVLGELPAAVKLLGVALIVVGSLVMHRKLFATGWTAPFQAIIQQKGSRYVLLVALILALTNPIEKQLILMSDWITPAFCYCVGLCLCFAALVWMRRSDCGTVMRKTPQWAILAGVLDAAALLLQYYTLTYLAVVITISIKRAGIVLAVLAGWLIFKERNITDKLIAASVMLGGVLILYLPLSALQASLLCVAVLAGMGIALFSTRDRAAATNNS